MSIQLKQINVQNLGPVKKLSLALGRFNLIYGRNERGKTFLVEFVIQSLFKHANRWRLRTSQAQGRVAVRGLDNGGTTDFSPSSAKKLEDFLEEQNPGLPPDFSKLLVVKGGEIQIANTDGGVDRTILKRFLSNKEILDNIDRRVSKTLQESRIENRNIVGPKRGEIIARFELEKQLQGLNKLFDQIEREYSGGRRRQLLDQKESINKHIAEMLRAKQHLACMIDQEIRRLKHLLNRIEANDLQEARRKLALYRQKDFEYRQKLELQRAAELKSRDYPWLKNVRASYEAALRRQPARPKHHLLALALLFLASSPVLVFLKMPTYAAAALVGVLLFGALYLRAYQYLLRHAVEIREIDELRNSFKDRFDQELTGLPVVLELLEKTEEDYNTARLLKKQLDEDLNQVHALKMAVSDQVFDFLGERKDSKTWDEVLRTIDSQIKSYGHRIKEKEISHARLAVDPSDYESSSPGVEFSQKKLEELQADLAATELEIAQESQQLMSLKQLVCQQTDHSISERWEVIIQHLRQKRQNILEAYKKKTAEIIGKIALKEVIRELRKDEDSKIIANLTSETVTTPLFEVTQRYTKVELVEERLKVSDPFNDFYLSDLSSGAQEQILLALRIGFAAKILGQQALFLILDDAFQHSDWQRRELLIGKVAELARSGWQITYFTMDDNLRDMFHEAGKSFGRDYAHWELAK